MDSPFQSPAVLSLCPGFLGLERGLQRAIGKINVVAYVEIEAFIVANLIAGMEAGMVDAAPVWTDVKTLNAKTFRKKIQGLIGGYPCQPFSLAGQRRGHEDPRHLWPHICRIIKAAGPVWCFFENVSGHLSMGYDQVYKDLRAMGYAVEAGIYTAEEAGAPHERERLFILAVSRSFLSRARRKQVGWTAWANTGGGSQGAELGDTAITRYTGCELCQQGWKKGTHFIDHSNKPLAHADSQPGQPQSATGMDMERHPLRDSGGNKNTNGPEPLSKTELGNAEITRYTGCELCQQGWIKGSYFIVNANSQISDTYPEQLQGWAEQPGNHEQKQQTFAGIYSKWPAGPGPLQYEWEAPRTALTRIALPNDIRQMGKRLWKSYRKVLSKEERKEIDATKYATIEPRMGSTIDGYNFREDLLRAFGNKVVEQTAEIAFIDLLNKFQIQNT